MLANFAKVTYLITQCATLYLVPSFLRRVREDLRLMYSISDPPTPLKRGLLKQYGSVSAKNLKLKHIVAVDLWEL
jgi:hypothetical protein